MATVVPMPAANVATVTSHRLFPGVARGVFVISALSGFLFFFHGCATVAPRACALTVLGSVPATAQGAAEVGVAGKVESDCEIVSPQSLAMALPTDRRTVAMAERLAYRAAVLAAATAYYEDSASGLEALEGSWAMARENPGLLPTDPADRAHVYQALGVLLLARYGESQLAGDELASWLARHLPDQVPSAQQLPPKLSVRAADALSRSHADKGTLTVGPARDCEEASLLLDGRRLGTLPLRDLPVHRGRHAIWFACGETVSWTRLLEVTETAVSLTGPKIAHEAVFDLGPGHLRLRAGAPDTSVAEPVRRLLPALGVDAIVLMPTTSGHDVLVVTAGDELVMPLHAGPIALTVRREDLWPRSWTGVAKWVAAGVSVVALGTGMTAHALHDRTVDDMRYGTIDSREGAEMWKKVAISGYATAATAAAGAVVLFLLDGHRESLPEPLF